MKRILAAVLTAVLLAGCSSALAASAPYVVSAMLEWDGKTYDVIEGQFKCVDRVPCTYYAIHNWYNEDGKGNVIDGAGYAGFQYKDRKTWTIMSVWHGKNGRARIEYAPDNAVAKPFDGEGSGMQILVPYEWEIGRWYTMRIEAVTEGNRTYFVQWVKPEKGSWTKLAVISYSKAHVGFKWDCFFLEDWIGNGLQRSCQLRGYYARRASDRHWLSLKTYKIYCSDKKAKYYSFCQIDERTAYIQSGGDALPAKKLPGRLTVNQPKEPERADLLGR